MEALCARLELKDELIAVLPLDVQREVLLKAVEAPTYICPKDNGKIIRQKARHLSQLSFVCKEWQDMCFPLLYANVSLPTLTHLRRYTRTLAARPELGKFARYFHYSGSTFPPHFLPQVFYHLPNLEHFLSQADATSILDADIDATKPRPKLVTLEIDPGVHDGEGRYVDARVERWCDLEKLRSLALVGLEAITNILPTNTAFPHLIELHLMHQEDDLDDEPAAHTLLLTILAQVGHQLHLLRFDEFSSEILPAPKEMFTLCPNLVTLSVSGLDIKPLVEEGHPFLRNWLLGDPWNYHNQAAYEAQHLESTTGQLAFADAEENVSHRLNDDDRGVIADMLAADKTKFPSLEIVLLWNVSFAEAANRSSPELKSICDAFSRQTGWKLGDRFAVGRDSSWETSGGEGAEGLGWVDVESSE